MTNKIIAPKAQPDTHSVMELRCSVCNSKVLWNNDYPFRPFCSQRCQQVDFSGWANGEKTIAGSSIYDDMNRDDLT